MDKPAEKSALNDNSKSFRCKQALRYRCFGTNVYAAGHLLIYGSADKRRGHPFFPLIGKWFIFSAVGLRLFMAGIRQTSNPAFTATEIFHINSTDSFPVIREPGFASLCFGLTGICSLFFPQRRIVSAFGSALHYGLAGLLHLLKKPAGANEAFALVTDVLIFIFLLVYFVRMFHSLS